MADLWGENTQVFWSRMGLISIIYVGPTPASAAETVRWRGSEWPTVRMRPSRRSLMPRGVYPFARSLVELPHPEEDRTSRDGEIKDDPLMF